MSKEFYKSKRFWTGIIGLITGISLIFTGEKTFNAMLPELVLTIIGLAQSILGIVTNTPITIGGRKISK